MSFRALLRTCGGHVRVALAVCAVLALQLAHVRTQGPEQRTIVRTIDGAEAARGEALVQFRDAPTAVLRRGPLAQYIDADVSATVSPRGLHRFRSRTFDVDALVAFLRTQPDVLYAEPNYVQRVVATPDDQYFPLLWGLLNTGQLVNGTPGLAGADISAAEAWDVSTGSRSVVVGVVDTGINHGHPDLAANMWSAPAPFSVVIGGATLVCPAGSHGFNAITNACDPQDDHYHGTHVAGTIGAVGNNGVGVAGVNWIASVIGAKFIAADGYGFTDDAVEAIEFLVQAKAAFSGSNGANIRWYFHQRKPPLEMINEVPAHGLAEFELYGKRWQVPAHAEDVLTRIYGDWQKPNPGYLNWRDCRAIVERYPWTGERRPPD